MGDRCRIRGFFEISLEWSMKFIEHRVADHRIHSPDPEMVEGRSIGGWPVVGDETGYAAGGCGFTTDRQRHICTTCSICGLRSGARKWLKGTMVILRYADDLVVGFQHRTDAERFLREFKDRLAKFDLELHPDKTRLIEFGRYCGPGPEAAWRGKTGNLHLPGLHPLTVGQRHKKGTFTVWRDHCEEANGREAQGYQGRATAPNARSRARRRWMASQGRIRLLPIPRRSRQHRPAAHLQKARKPAVA